MTGIGASQPGAVDHSSWPDPAQRLLQLICQRLNLTALQRRDRALAVKEAETYFERADKEFGDVKVPYGDTVGQKSKSELHEIRYLSVGKEVQEIEGDDQDGKRFKLSDYRGKIVLLYFWSEY